MERNGTPPIDSSGLQETPDMNSTEGRPNSVVIFQFGDEGDNYVFNIPALTIANRDLSTLGSSLVTAMNQQPQEPTPNDTPTTPAARLAETTDNNVALSSATSSNDVNTTQSQQSQPSPASTQSNTTESTSLPTNPPSDNSRGRTISVSVSYVYAQSTPSEATPEFQRTGTITLNVPDVPVNRTEAQMNVMIELAASIALGAVAAFTQRRRVEISKQTFESFPLVDTSTVSLDVCPICHEDYEIVNKTVNDAPQTKASVKRARESDDEDEESSGPNPAKRAKNDNTSAAEHAEATDHHTHPSTATSSLSSLETEDEYTHAAIRLPCEHVFGRNCVYEWLKMKNTCPLCRKVVHSDVLSQVPPQLINLPNISHLMDPSNRGRPMVVVLDRNTNTLITRQSNTAGTLSTDPPSTATTEDETVYQNLRSLLDDPPVTTNTTPPARERPAARLMRELGLPLNPLMPSGVASLRTANGVETVNLDNDSHTMPFGEPGRSRRRDRRLSLMSPTGRRNILGFNDDGEVIRIPDSSLNSNGDSNESAETTATGADGGATAQPQGDE
ncbi:Protein SAN1 [Cyberlindnera fabianii]|uniref:Protein SAN1 n=1 Tax=Cyberlindnera fabianii TaxID=36022 RepID=A0A1V2L9E6_CYBFA|nr:Protein SAN1 [Cyberlindnera fabianii]